jgi:hypothetical protein
MIMLLNFVLMTHLTCLELLYDCLDRNDGDDDGDGGDGDDDDSNYNNSPLMVSPVFQGLIYPGERAMPAAT